MHPDGIGFAEIETHLLL